jgi:pyruvate dehydrogenase E1 component alpha subunit
LENDVASQEEIDKVQNDVYEAIGDALQFARESPYPDEADLFTDLFADPIPLR